MVKLIPPIGRALAHANLTKDQIDDVEIIGGSSRVPGVQDAVRAYFGWDGEGAEKQLAVHLNAEEVSVLLCTVTFHANHAHNLTRSP
jgi:molecular chaperone DnaK (HSP70)